MQDVAKAIAVGQHALHAEVLRADQLAAGPVAADAAARLLRGHGSRHDHRRRQGADEGDRRRIELSLAAAAQALPDAAARLLERRPDTTRWKTKRRCIPRTADASGFSIWRRRLPSSLAFTAYPLGQMMWMSLHNWSLIEPPRNMSASAISSRPGNDPQFWASLGFTLKYTLLITPILMILGYPDRAADRAQHAAAADSRAASCSRRSSSASAHRACSGTGCSATISAWSTASLIDLGIIAKPVVWFGADADRRACGRSSSRSSGRWSASA